MRIGDILISIGAISEETLSNALKMKDKDTLIGEYLLDNKIISEEDYIKSLSIQSNIPIVNLEEYEVDRNLSTYLKQAFCIRNSLAPFKVTDSEIYIAISDPYNFTVRDVIESSINKTVVAHLASNNNITDQINLIYSNKIREVRNTALKIKGAELMVNSMTSSNSMESVSTDVVVSYLNTLIINAKSRNVSDIHIDAHKDTVLIRFRIDGVLVDIDKLDTVFLNNLVRHIKIRSELDVTLNRVPQDGRFAVKVTPTSEIDLRASIIPTMYGEKCVLRLLDKEKTIPTLETIGLLKSDYTKILDMIKKPQGIILVCGPTGSGKSTTSTSILNKLISSEKNIMTLEDPIEYVLPGVNQSNIDTAAGYTFERGLRTILRQDPDIILIGEIRDEITARMAISAATTGHLVISTLHTNDSIGAITRLRDMGIESYHIADSLIGVISQRLVRKLCTFCSVPSSSDLDKIQSRIGKVPVKAKVRANIGCPKCHKGYKGRVPLNEVLLITDELKQAIYQKASNKELYNVATKNGFEPIKVSAYKQILLGNTTFEEIDKLLGGI